MTYRWATWLEPALRTDPFVAERLIVSTAPDWKLQGRPPSQFSFLPTGVVEHHTADMAEIGHDPARHPLGILAGNSVAPGPISQLCGTWTPPDVKWTGSNADPRVFLIAAGRCNHAGGGEYPWGAPDGNGSSIGIEWCGPPRADGVAWPDIVLELRERVTCAILRWNGWGVHQVCSHNEYARPKGRKIDPSGAWSAEPSIGHLKPWNMDLYRARLAARLAPPVIPSPPEPETPPVVIPPVVIPPEEDDMAKLQQIRLQGDAAVYARDGFEVRCFPSVAVQAAAVRDGLVEPTETILHDRHELGMLDLVGVQADYSTLTPEQAARWPERTTGADFRTWTP